jgi:hypothetical protein
MQVEDAAKMGCAKKGLIILYSVICMIFGIYYIDRKTKTGRTGS